MKRQTVKSSRNNLLQAPFHFTPCGTDIAGITRRFSLCDWDKLHSVVNEAVLKPSLQGAVVSCAVILRLLISRFLVSPPQLAISHVFYSIPGWS